MFKNNGDRLSTSSLLFAYKPGLSTTMCTTVAKEVVQYYKNSGIDVHVCLLEASKTFNTLFRQLLAHRFPTRYISLVMNGYLDQSIQGKLGIYCVRCF